MALLLLKGDYLKVLLCENDSCPRPGREFPHSGRGRTPKFCSADCRRAGDAQRQREGYFPVAEQRQIMSEAQGSEGYWRTDPDVPHGAPSYLEPVDLAELDLPEVGEGDSQPESGLGYDFADSSSASAGLRPSYYDPVTGDYYFDRVEDPRIAKEVPKEVLAKYPLDKSWADKGVEIPAPGSSHGFGGPWIHRDPGWIPVDEWLAQQPDDGEGWFYGKAIVPGSDVHLGLAAL